MTKIELEYLFTALDNEIKAYKFAIDDLNEHTQNVAELVGGSIPYDLQEFDKDLSDMINNGDLHASVDDELVDEYIISLSSLYYAKTDLRFLENCRFKVFQMYNSKQIDENIINEMKQNPLVKKAINDFLDENGEYDVEKESLFDYKSISDRIVDDSREKGNVYVNALNNIDNILKTDRRVFDLIAFNEPWRHYLLDGSYKSIKIEAINKDGMEVISDKFQEMVLNDELSDEDIKTVRNALSTVSSQNVILVKEATLDAEELTKRNQENQANKKRI